MFKYFGKIVFC